MYTSGIKVCKVSGKDVAYLDYGDVACESIASITREGNTKEIEIGNHKKYFQVKKSHFFNYAIIYKRRM